MKLGWHETRSGKRAYVAAIIKKPQEIKTSELSGGLYPVIVIHETMRKNLMGGHFLIFPCKCNPPCPHIADWSEMRRRFLQRDFERTSNSDLHPHDGS